MTAARPAEPTALSNCRLCDAVDLAKIADRGDLALFRCRRCRFISGDPALDSASDHYGACYEHGQPAAPSTRYHEWLATAEAAVGKGRLLEVGAGSGGFVNAALARGWAVDATEVSESGLARLRATGAGVLAGDLSDLRLRDATYDFVASLEVIEHVADPARHLRELARLTRAGGLLLLTTPNFTGLSRRLFGIRWRVVDPEHLGYFAPPTLDRALRDAGFGRVCVRSRTLDVTTWRTSLSRREPARFDPRAAASARDRVEASRFLRWGKDLVNAALGITALGDALVAWAVR